LAIRLEKAEKRRRKAEGESIAFSIQRTMVMRPAHAGAENMEKETGGMR